jgi:hypothetical protein
VGLMGSRTPAKGMPSRFPTSAYGRISNLHWEAMAMRAFLVACVAAIVIAGTAAAILTSSYVPNSAASAFSTQSVRL